MTDFAGKVFTMESFSSLTTSGSGEITVELENTPAGDDAILINLQGVAGAFAQFSSRSGKNITVKVYQKYDRLKTSAGSAVALPTSVTSDSTVGGPTITTGGPSTIDIGTGSYGSSCGGNDHTHNLTINKVITHSHDVEATTLSTLNSTGGITLVIGYAIA